MTPIWRCCYWHLGLASWLVIGGALATSGDCAKAQITPDATLGAESSVVTPTNINGLPTEQIDGGATRGANLFHSFEQFSIPTGGAAHFNNALNIQNIISRVTGRSVSNIDGLIRANASANLFLLNPNGIIFGRNATLNIGGSFLATTASAVNFADGTQFSATAPQATPLLTVSVPLGLQYGANPGSIQVQGNGQGLRSSDAAIIDTTFGLRVQPNQTLAIVGGDVALIGGTLKTAGGRIELGSVAGSGLVSLSPTENGFSLGYESVPTFGDIQLSGEAAVNASGAGGGDIQVWGRRVTLTDGSQIEASTLGAEAGGTLAVTASESLEVIGTSANGQSPSGLFALVYPGATGAGGNLTVETGRLLVRDGAQVGTFTSSTGDGGTLSVTAADAVELSGTSVNGEITSGLLAITGGDGDAGDLTINTERLVVRYGAQVSTSTFDTGAGGTLSVTASDAVEVIGTSADGDFSGLLAIAEGAGDAGDLRITTGRLLVSNGAAVSTTTLGAGNGGNLLVRATDSVEVVGTTSDGSFPAGLLAGVFGEGSTRASGNLTIETGTLSIRDGGRVSTETAAQGNAGNIQIRAGDLVEVVGEGPRPTNPQQEYGFYSTLNSDVSSSGVGNGGNLTIETRTLSIRDGGEVSAAIYGQGDGGNIEVRASDLVEVVGAKRDGLPSGLATNVLPNGGIGNAGNVTVNTRVLSLRDGGQVTAETNGVGSAGNIHIRARDAVELVRVSPNSNLPLRSSIRTNVLQRGKGSGGSVTVETGRLILRDGEISASTAGDGNAGNILLQASDAVELSGSSQIAVTSRESSGNGGRITIETGRLQLADTSLVSAITNSQGRGGTLTVRASESVQLSGSSVLSVSSLGAGDAGNLTIETGQLLAQGSRIVANTLRKGRGGNVTIGANQLILRDGALVNVSSTGLGAAGNLEVTADSVLLDNGFLAAQTAAGDRGNITVRSQGLILRDDSRITTDARGTATGGNITLNTDVLAALENSDITANAQQGSGGRVIINAQGIFGTQFRDAPTPESDITASSNLGPQFSGTVEIDIPDVDTSLGLATLPAQLVEVSGLIATGCAADEENKFIVTGRGGLPPNPGDTLTGEAVLADWITLDPEVENRSGAVPTTNPTIEQCAHSDCGSPRMAD